MDLPAPANLMATAQPVAPPAMPAPVTHDVTIVTTKKLSQARVMGVAPEEFGIERGARDIKSCNYCFHDVVTKTEGELIAEGYDEVQVRALPDYRSNTNQEEISRDSVSENAGPSSIDTSARQVKVTAHYIRMDREGNGRPCLYQVMTGGDDGDILRKDGKEDIEPIDAIPFAATTPVPITHRFFGRSLADLVMDIQRIKTALLRSALDNKYLANNPRVEVAESFAGPNTLDDLLVSRPGGVVRTKQPGGLQWQTVPDVSASTFGYLEYMDSVREMRTGVTKQGQGVDANALQNQSATAVNQVFTMSQARMKLIARIMAEGVRDIFSLLHGTIRKHGQQAQTVRLRNAWVNVDPRQWKTRNDMTINVGLGNGGKAEQFAQTMGIANFQKELLLGGKTNLVDDQKLYNTAAMLAKISGHRNADQFFNDPSEKDQSGKPKYPPPPPPPNPELLKIQADTQMKQAELQMKGQEIQANAEIDKQADERKAGIEQVQAQADIATQDRKTQAEMAMMQQKFEFEKELKLMDFQLKREAQAAELEMKREMHAQSLQQAQLGMVASAQSHDAKMEQMASKSEKSGD